MALIKCPECKKKVSDKADRCVHCGYPMDLAQGREHRREGALYRLELEAISEDGKLKAVEGLRLIFEFGLAEAKAAVESVPCVLVSGLYLSECERLKASMNKYGAELNISIDAEACEHNPFFVNSKYARGGRFAYTPQCPKCKSLDIITVEKPKKGLFSVLFGKGRKYTSVCRSCGREFTPRV